MLRLLYRWVLQAHPPHFRQRFTEEMLAIFDETGGRLAVAILLGDAVVSLGRQWALRPRFWEAPAQAPAEGGALFSQLSGSPPRPIALVYGALLSALVLNGISMSMGYMWDHPHYMEIQPPVSAPPVSWPARSEPLSAATESMEPPLSTDQGRVLLVFNAPTRPVSSIAATPAPVLPGAAEPDLPLVCRPYLGSYVSSPPVPFRVSVTATNGRLQVEVEGRFRSLLASSSQASLWTCETMDCRVSFFPNAKGEVDRLEVRFAGQQISAFRERRGMIF